jgi:DNA end-binding protein Ku
MARVIWQGAISFSLIHIPVALHSASRSNSLDLDLLDRRDFSPVGYQRVNKKTGKDVEWEISSRATSTSPANTWR